MDKETKELLVCLRNSYAETNEIENLDLFLILKAANDIVIEIGWLMDLIKNTIQKNKEWREGLNQKSQ